MCVNCNDTLFNGQNSIIPEPICKDCGEIQVCEDGILATDCVYSVKALPCIGSGAGEQLSSILDKVETYICSQSPSGNTDCCTSKTYTINSVCRGEGSIFVLAITPNFTYNYPLAITASLKVDSGSALYSRFQLNSIYQNVVQNTAISSQITLYSVFGSINLGGLTGAQLIFQITDNLGNYSEPFTINSDDIVICS